MTTSDATANTTTRLLACWCSSDGGSKLAVIRLTPNCAASLLEQHTHLLQLKTTRLQLLRVEYENIDVRFFDEVFYPREFEAAITSLFELAREYSDDDDSDWFDLPTTLDLPTVFADYRTSWESCVVSESMLYWTAAGKHGGKPFETADILPFIEDPTSA